MLITTLYSFCQSDSIEYSLYPGTIPNNKGEGKEVVDVRSVGGRFISYIFEPTLTYIKPKHPINKAIIICPGGGYRGVSIDKEGFLAAREFQKKGIHAFVLKYRAPNDKTNIDKSLAPIQDAQQAIIRARELLAEKDYSDVKIGIMGFSAGGHLASHASTAYGYNFVTGERVPDNFLRPDFSILIYPVISMEHLYTHHGSRFNLLGSYPSTHQIDQYSTYRQVNALSPPAFLVHASDDGAVPVKNSLLYYEACVSHGVSAEMHIYPEGGHGFGMYNKTTEDKWMDRLFNWLMML